MSSSVPPRSVQRLQIIDWARGLAIITVVLYHSSQAVTGEPMRWQGYLWDPASLSPSVSILNVLLQWLQVPSMFFLISGYLVHRSMARYAGQGTGSLLLRRALRLYVPYLIVLAFYALFWPRTRLAATPEGMLDGFLHILLIHNFSNETVWSINASFWYVANELQLCALYPLMMVATRRFGWNSTILVLLAIELGSRMVGSIVAAHSVQGDLTAGWLMRWPGTFVLTWYLGAWIAELQRTGVLRQPGLALKLGLPVTGAVAAVLWPLSGVSPTIMAVCYGVWLAALLARQVAVKGAGAAAAGPAPGYGQRLVATLGSLSLGIYLLNQPIIIELEWRMALWIDDPGQRIFATAAAALVLLVPAAWLMARLVEQPLGRMLDSWVEKYAARGPLPAKAKAPVRT